MRQENAAADSQGTRVAHTEMIELARSASTDRGAAERIVQMLLPRTRYAVRMLVGMHAGAEDLVQISIVEILTSLSKYRGEASLKTWADAVTYRVVMRHMKRTRRQERRFQLVAEVEEPAPGDGNEEGGREGIRKTLAVHLERLTEEKRVTLLLRLVLGHSVTEVADLTGVGVNTARGRLRAGLRELRESIAGDDGLLAELGRVSHETT